MPTSFQNSLNISWNGFNKVLEWSLRDRCPCWLCSIPSHRKEASETKFCNRNIHQIRKNVYRPWWSGAPWNLIFLFLCRYLTSNCPCNAYLHKQRGWTLTPTHHTYASVDGWGFCAENEWFVLPPWRIDQFKRSPELGGKSLRNFCCDFQVCIFRVLILY